MLHLTTEVGVPGKNEREKRHFPELQNAHGVTKYKPRGRVYIPHGKGEEFLFKAHPQHISPKYTDFGLDYTSKLRPLASPPHADDYPTEECFPDNWRPLRTFPDETLFLLPDKEISSSFRTNNEWMLYPEGLGYDSTLRSRWNGVHKASQLSENEITHTMKFGKGRIVYDKRNHIPVAAPGDKSYQAVEYSPSFHKYGSTLPVVNFGGNTKYKVDTFVPLIELPPLPSESYASKEKLRILLSEIGDVASLENFRPSSPLVIPPNNIHGQTPNYHQNTQSTEALDTTKNSSSNNSSKT